MKEIKIHIEGMKCEGCVNRVKNVVGSLKDVSTYDVSLENKELVATKGTELFKLARENNVKYL